MAYAVSLLPLLAVVSTGLLFPPTLAVQKVDLAELASNTKYTARKRGEEGDAISSLLHLGNGVSLEVVDSLVTAQGNVKSKYRETYDGIVVYNTGLDVEQDENGDGDVVEADVYTGLDDDLTGSLNCQLDNNDAEATVLHYLGLDNATVETVKFQEVIYIDAKDKAHDAVDVDLFIKSPSEQLSRPRTFVDKCSRKVLESFDRIGLAKAVPTSSEPKPTPSLIAPKETRTLDAVGEGPPRTYCAVKQRIGNPNRPLYIGHRGHCLTLRKSDDSNTCFLENQYVRGVDMRGKASYNKTLVASFNCTEGYLDQTQGAYSPMIDAFFYATKTMEMYRKWYDYEAMSDGVPYVKVHLDYPEVNAFYDENALYFTDGDGVNMYPLTVLDIVAHEISHGVVEKTSGLVYSNQSGGINEAFSDMAGAVAELYVFGKYNWYVGSDVFIKARATLRFFKDPTLDRKSIKHIDDYKPDMDVHHSSGIYNHVFWQIANRRKMGVRAAFECFLVATRLYWRETTDFESGACGVVRGAYDSGYDMDLVAKSFRTVGITFKACPNFNKLVTAELKQGDEHTRLVVSRRKNPLFKIVVPSGVTKVTVTGSRQTYVTLARSYSRLSKVLGQGLRSAKAKAKHGDVIYARFSLGSKVSRKNPIQATASVSYD